MWLLGKENNIVFLLQKFVWVEICSKFALALSKLAHGVMVTQLFLVQSF